MPASMRTAVVLLLLAAVCVSVDAQIQVCQNIKPGPVKAGTIKMQASAYSNSYSDLTVNWPRPNDAPGGNGPPSCINEYSVEVFRRDGLRIQSATVTGMSAAHSSASFTAKGLSPGEPYQFTVTPRGPGGVGPTDIKSTPFTTAPAPAAPSCRQPQSVSNIRREGAYPSGSMVMMTIAWDKPYGQDDSCIKEYVVAVYETGSNSAIKTTTVYAPNTRYSDNIYSPGKSYEFYIYARNPNIGASGNGVGLRSQPIFAPTQAAPLKH